MSSTDTFLTEAEYLLREPEAEYKSEFRDGRVVAMSGAGPAHSIITVNLISSLHHQLQGKPCTVYSSDTRIKVAAARFYTYPDLSVTCESPQFDKRDPSALLNPTLLVEVLSPSTEAYDRREKFRFYQKLASLQEYLLVAQDRMQVERFSRQEDGTWNSFHGEGADADIHLPSVGCTLTLRNIYDKV